MTNICTFRITFLQLITMISLVLVSSNASAQLPCGQTIDFNTWSQEGSPTSGVWNVNGGGNNVVQTVNASATWFVSPNDFIDVLIQGSIQVNTAGDDDAVGFVFGYQEPFGALVNPASTPMKSFIFDWKQNTQTYQGMTCFEGFALYEIDGLFNFNGTVGGANAQVYPEFWERINTPIVNVLDTDYANNGWNDFQQYNFQLKYTRDSIVIWIDGARIFEEAGCFEPGRFGFYNQSQNIVNYSNFSYNIEHDFEVSDSLICLGDTSFFEIGLGCIGAIPPTTSFNWDFDNGTTSSGIDPFHVFSALGTYNVQLISSDPFGCLDTSIQIVEVMDYPIANAGLDDTACQLSYNLNALPDIGQWSSLNGGVFSDASLFNSSVTVPAAGIYGFVWEVTNIAGCSSSDTVTITFSDLSLTAGLTNPTCFGSTNGEIDITTAGGVQPITFQWDAATGNQTSTTAINLGGGMFGVIVTDDVGCIIDTSFVLAEPLPLTFTLDLIPSDCDFLNGSATISSISGGTAPYSYDWGAGFVLSDFSSGLGLGTYSLTISDDLGCDTTLTFTIGNNPFSISANVVQHISCFGFNDGEAIAFGSNMLSLYTYQWGASSNNQTTQTATNLIPGIHEVTVSSAAGCSETTTITILEPTPLSLAVTDISVCSGNLASLSAIASGGTPTYTYAWENSLGQVQNPIDILVTQTEAFTVSAIDANGCELSDNLTITALETPVASFVVDETQACNRPAYLFNFQNTSTPAGGTINWDFGDNTIGTGNTATHSYMNSGVYDVSIEVISPDGCSDTYLEAGLITIFPNPTADFTFSPEHISTVNPNIQFVDLSYDDIISWNWSFGGLSASTTQNPTHNFEQSSGYQTIILEVENNVGCADSTFRIIEVEDDFAIYAPNAFTPDGDEYNQVWKVHLLGLDLFDVEINIYNRWGERVWQSFDVNVGWDGSYNGTVAPDGMYTWTLVAGDLNSDEKIERVGHVSILR